METSSEGVIIADTRGLVSLFLAGAHHHAIAVKTAHRSTHKDMLIPAAGVPKSGSLTDCIVMTVADVYGTKATGFDRQFADAGYKRLAPSTDWHQAV